MTPYAELSLAYMESHAAAAAARLERFDPPEIASALLAAPSEVASAVLARMAPRAASAALAALPTEAARRMLEAVPVRVGSMLLRRLSPAVRTPLLDHLPDALKRTIARQLEFPEHSVGGLADPLVTALPSDTRVAQALDHVRTHPDHIDHELFVTDRDHRLQGTIALRLLVAASPGAELDTLATPVGTYFLATADVRVLLHSPAWAETHTVPVVDETGIYVGALRYDAIRRVADEARMKALPAATSGALIQLNQLVWTGSVRLLGELVGAAFERRDSGGTP